MLKNKSFIFVLCFILLSVSTSVHSFEKNSLEFEEYIELTPSNIYVPNGNLSVFLVLDTFYSSQTNNILIEFDEWVEPYERTFCIQFNFEKVSFYTPGLGESLWDSHERVIEEFNWKEATTPDDSNLDENGYDILIVFQEKYNTGQNHVNSILGNSLIISEEQSGSWTTPQFILIHELGHLFGGVHEAEGEIPKDWYGNANLSFMDYYDLGYMTYMMDFSENNLPLDDYNYDTMVLKNQTEDYGFPNYTKRFDLNDPDKDNLPNWWEYKYELNATFYDKNEDKDSDGISNYNEWLNGTYPNTNDTDKDGIADLVEIMNNSDPLGLTTNITETITTTSSNPLSTSSSTTTYKSETEVANNTTNFLGYTISLLILTNLVILKRKKLLK